MLLLLQVRAEYDTGRTAAVRLQLCGCSTRETPALRVFLHAAWKPSKLRQQTSLSGNLQNLVPLARERAGMCRQASHQATSEECELTRPQPERLHVSSCLCLPSLRRNPESQILNPDAQKRKFMRNGPWIMRKSPSKI